MKKKRGIGLILLALTLFLAACGSGSVSKKGINEISHKDLLKQLDNNETFWLITLDADPKLVEESGALGKFETNLQKSGIENAVYVNTHGLSEDEKNNLSDKYTHLSMTNQNSSWNWKFDKGGLVYVSNGSVFQSGASDGTLYDFQFEENDMEKLKKEIETNVANTLNGLEEWNIDFEL